jgi:hypothetical protein
MWKWTPNALLVGNRFTAAIKLAEGGGAVERDAEARRDVRGPDPNADMGCRHLARIDRGHDAVQVLDAVAEDSVHLLARHQAGRPPLAGAVQDHLVRTEADFQCRLHLGEADRLGIEAVVQRQLDQPLVGLVLIE